MLLLTNRHRPLLWIILLISSLLSAWLAGCNQDQVAPPEAPEAAVTSTVMPQPPMPAVAAPAPAASPTLPGPPAIDLVWWIPPAFAPSQETEAGRLLDAQLQTFQEANPTLLVKPVLKAPHGEGGLLDFMLNAQKVAPKVLPDLVALDSRDLGVAMRAGLLQPLDTLLPADLLNDLYPFALNVGRLDGKIYAVQFEVDIEHTIFRSDIMSTAPRTWEDVLAGGHIYIFPTGTENNPGDSFLIQYHAAGGQLGRRNEPFVLNERALLSTLTFYHQARNAGIIPATVLGMDSIEDTWPVFEAGRADIAHVLASRYLRERSRSANLGFGPVPTPTGEPATISQGWTLAIITSDSERQAAAARLIETLLNPTLNGAWAQANQRVPTRRSGLASWDQADPYTSFLSWQLEAAAFTTAEASYLRAAPILAAAQRDVLNGSLTPSEATERATGLTPP